MNSIITWLEAHDKLAGWAQFVGAVLALFVTYFTAFAPGWRRKRQLHSAAKRLLANGYEVIESYHRTSEKFPPFPLSIRAASLTMTAVAEEIDRFPIFELDNNLGPYSLARRLRSMSGTVSLLSIYLEKLAGDLDARDVTEEDRETLKIMLSERLVQADALVTGKVLQRPEWPSPEPL